MAFQFRHHHRVTYSDCDCTMGNHVYHARYLDILEAARGEFFRAAGVPLASLHQLELFFPSLSRTSTTRPRRARMTS